MIMNQFNNNSEPWPSTIPQQMPWMTSHQASSPEMQFGQPLSDQTLSATIVNPILSPYNVIPAHSDIVPSLAIPPDIPSTSSTCVQPNVTTNPFDPCLATQNIVPVMDQSQMSSQYPTCMNASNSQQYSANPQPCYYQSLTPIFSDQDQSNLEQPVPQLKHKRNSIEMEDDQIKEEEPPTKQQLSELRLLNRFGSLHLDGGADTDCYGDNHQDSSSSDDEETTSTRYNKGVVGRKEFSRYVYLLFKEKKSNNLFNRATNSAFDRLMRDEREKLSKAVILWSPPLRETFAGSSTVDSDDDEDFEFSDHKDFLKKPTNESITITEITDDEPCDFQVPEPSPEISDDNMIEE